MTAPAPASEGVFAALCTVPGSSPYTFDTGSQPFAFFKEGVKKTATLWNPPFIRGTRSPCALRTRSGPYTVGGPLVLTANPADLAIWLPRILGAAGSGNTFALAETLPSFGMLINRVAQTFQYTNCKVNSALFRSRAGANPDDPAWVELTLDIWGISEITGTSYPVLTLDCSSIAYQPLIFSDGVITLLSSARNIMNFALLIHNHLERRFTNSITATSLVPTDRTVALRTTNPYTADELDLYNQDPAGASGSLVLTNAGVSTTFTFNKLQVPALSPVVGGKTEIPLYLDMIARSANADEISVVNDSAP